MRHSILVLCAGALLLNVTACKSGAVDQKPHPTATAPAPKTTAPPTKNERLDIDAMTLAQAKDIAAELKASQRIKEDNPLLTPKSLDDVNAILKRDQLTLFGAGVAFAGTQKSIEAQALAAQIELAWAQAQTIVANVLSATGKRLEKKHAALRTKKTLHAAEQGELHALAETIYQTRKLKKALSLLAAEHAANGEKMALAFIKANPDSYLGYRVAADYYRMKRDWTQFDLMIAKLTERNPDSNGLLFLKGCAAFDRAQDSAKAAEFFTRALENDPQFVRAQAHLLLVQKDIASIYAEFEKLKTINPEHQIVRWAGYSIKKAHEQLGQKTP